MGRKCAVVAALTVGAFLCRPEAIFARQQREEALLARVRELEKRVVALEKAVKALEAQAKRAGPTGVEDRLVGTWVVAEADRKEARLTDLKFTRDRCTGVMKGAKGPVKFTEPYRLVGRQVSMTVSREDVLLRFDLRIVSVTDTELVLEPAPGKKVRYVREK